MREFSGSYVLRVLFATTTPGGGPETVARRWHRLATSSFDSYRPELHYMRGPGPKWRKKHGHDAER
jgi:hypothetical protein